MPRTIEIMNPLQGGQKYMTTKRAADFVRRGIAEIVNGKLRFTEENQVQREAEAEFRRNRGKAVYWNGSSRDPRATYKPGQVRS